MSDASALRRYLLPNLLIGLAYYAAGHLGLLLAIPPGYATAVWPPSGIALACVLLWGYRVTPGIWFGSFFINVWTGLDTSSTAAVLDSLAVPAAIGSGAALQAAAGALLIRRFVGYRNLLNQELEVVRILVLGGPLACIINASIGVGVLTLRGLVPPDSALFNWWTWWVGDSIGVLVFTPLLLVWTARPRAVWLSRQIMVSAPLILVFALAVGLFFYTSHREQERIKTEFQGWGRDFSRAVEEDMRRNIAALYNLRALYASVERLDRQAFATFTREQLARRPGIQALEWAPVVAGADRAAFERQVRAEGFPQFVITERAADGRVVPAQPRDEYVAVEYVAPLQGNEAALGYAGAVEPTRAAAIRLARDSGEPAMSARLRLVQDAQGHYGLLVFLPCYAAGLPAGTPQERGAALRGYMEAVLHMPDLMQDSLRAVEARGVQVRLTDEDAPPEQRLLYGADPTRAETVGGLEQDIPLLVAGRHWQMHLTLPAQYLTAHKSWQAWTLLAGGMLFTGLLGMFMLVVIGRTARLDELVDRRTAELSRLNSSLSREVGRSERLEAEARDQATRLAASNRELEQFAYVASHDLQAPLRSVASFATLLQRRYRGQLGQDADEFLAAIRESVRDMQALIDDLLALSRVNTQGAAMTSVSTRDIVGKACQQLAEDLKAAQAQVHCGELPVVHGDARMLTQLFQNLIGNGIKFQAKGVSPEIRIGAQLHEGEWRFTVRDNGIGIATEHQQSIFMMFKRLHPAEQYPGTGVGLALCSKIVHLHGGRIWVESQPGEGTSFVFTLQTEQAAAILNAARMPGSGRQE